jgi:hypothetical protein
MNIKKYALIAFLSISSYSQGVSFMPQPFNFDSTVTLPKDPSEVLNAQLPYFKQFPIDSGKICPKDGILISDKTAAEYVFYKAGYARQDKELQIAKYLLNQYYTQSIAAEKVYQKQITVLEKEVKRNWFEKNSIYSGFICGLATAILTENFVIKASK